MDCLTSRFSESLMGRILVPPELIDDFYTSIGMDYTAIINGDHLPLCSEFDDSWSVSFDFGGWDSYDGRYTITVTGDELANPGSANSQENCFPPFESSEAFGYGLSGADLSS
ncbi:uncharacterized protein L3040_003430 [Drepanopeziza brunnea f. sp. 'multigermtubi']|uniref:uncharacterized protein n=1 Tax=Drepanopeziza brunnea f. sp. 'multigermtubi' TaxID=698441 RepID=UPI00238B9343|nr:hypothetical protein L3040_003430 [Drepanopeziza brunnea f. sp. 'multigermtubi']